MRLAEVCKRMQMPGRIPDKYSRATNFLAAVDDVPFKQLESILEDADNYTGYRHDVDIIIIYKKTVKLCLLAETRLKKRISAVTMAGRLRRDSNTPKKKESPANDTEQKVKKEENSILRRDG